LEEEEREKASAIFAGGERNSVCMCVSVRGEMRKKSKAGGVDKCGCCTNQGKKEGGRIWEFRKRKNVTE